jgi:hypothetical protein
MVTELVAPVVTVIAITERDRVRRMVAQTYFDLVSATIIRDGAE